MIIEAAKAMIHDQGLPIILWAKASSTVVYVHNTSPHKIMRNLTLEEALTGVKPEVRHFGYLFVRCTFMCPRKRGQS